MKLYKMHNLYGKENNHKVFVQELVKSAKNTIYKVF